MDDVREATNRGKFGYEVLGNNIIIPYIFRENETYCATKIFQWYFDQQEIGISSDLVDFKYLKGFNMYRNEATLMNEINEWHNNSMYPFRFTTIDTLVKMKDVCDIFKFLNDCGQKSKLGDQYEMMAGMVQIRFETSDITWPYVVQNGKRYTPTDILSVPRTLSSTVILTDIEVMYMKYVLSVLNIEMAITKPYQMVCVLLDEAVAHFIEESQQDENYEFDDNYWPTKKIIRKIDTKKPSSLNNNNLPFSTTAKINVIADENPVETKKPDNQKKKTVIFKYNIKLIRRYGIYFVYSIYFDRQLHESEKS